jgi:hypothetical protein
MSNPHASWWAKITELIRDLVLIFRPTYPEACSRYQASSSVREIFELPSHVAKALDYVKEASGDLDHPNFDAALKLFYTEWQRNGLDRSSRSWRKIQKTLTRWGAIDPVQTAFMERFGTSGDLGVS